jgi:hypothetical protein
MFSVFNLLCITFLASRIYVAHRFLKNLCVSDLGQIAHLGARSDCFQHKVIHLNKKCMFLISESSSFFVAPGYFVQKWW